MKKKHLLVALGFMLATATPLCVNAQDSSTTGITDSYALTVKSEYADSQPEPPKPCDPDGSIAGYDYVDLGLPSGTLWATYNVGTTSPCEIGSYFAWGEVEPRDYFEWINYKYWIKCVVDPEKGIYYDLVDIGKEIYGTEYDAAAHQWGNGWRMPNDRESYELRMYCWHRWTEENGVMGTRVYGPNQHSIFLPACGYGKWYTDPQLIGIQGGYWTGFDEPEVTFCGYNVEPSSMAMGIYVDSSGLQRGGSWKAGGKNIRAVINPKEAGITVLPKDSDFGITYSNGTVRITGKQARYLLSLRNMSGQTVFSTNIEGNACKLSPLAKGMYIVSVSDGKNIKYTKKITIK